MSATTSKFSVPAGAVLGVGGINPSTLSSPNDDKHSQQIAACAMLATITVLALLGWGTFKMTQSESISLFTHNVQQYHGDRMNPVRDLDSEEVRNRHYKATADQVASQRLFDRPQLRLGASKRETNPMNEYTAAMEDQSNDIDSEFDSTDQSGENSNDDDNHNNIEDEIISDLNGNTVNTPMIRNRETFLASHPHRDPLESLERKPHPKLSQMKQKGDQLIELYKKELLERKLNPDKEQSLGKGLSKEMQQKLDPLMFIKRVMKDNNQQQ